MTAASAGVWSMRCPQCGQPLGELPTATSMPMPAPKPLPAPPTRPPATPLPSSVGPSADAASPAADAPALRCPACATRWPRTGGIWRFLGADDAARLTAFIREYTAVRHAEGRAAMTAAQRLALPYALPSTPLAWQWRIRTASYRALCRSALGGVLPVRLVDVGAGTGWLAWRLAVGGAAVLAVDVSDDAGDGLAAGECYATDLACRALGDRFVRAQAHADRLPLADGAADAVIFNASLHYAADPAATLAEAARVVRPGGRVVVVDSPIYGRRSSGEQMVAERTAAFEARYGFPSTSQGSREFLVAGELERIGAPLGLSFTHVRPFAGVRWALRPLAARLRGRRAPARFAVSLGTKSGKPARDGGDRCRESGRSRML